MIDPLRASAIAGRSRNGTLRAALCDTDYLMNQVRDAIDPLGAFFAGFPGPQLRVYAAQHVFDELYRDDGHGHRTKWHKLSEQAHANGKAVSARVFRDAFERRFLEDITFINMGELFGDHPLVERVRAVRNGKGASDTPTAQLAVLLSRLRPVTYSHDEHLYKAGVAPRPRNLPAVSGAEGRVTHGELVHLGTTGLAAGTVAGADYLLRALGGLLGSPPWLSRVIAMCLGTWALSDPARRSATGRILTPVLEAFADHSEKIANGLAVLDQFAVDVEPGANIECRVAEILVRRAKDGPLLAKEIQEELAGCTSSPVEIPTVGELRVVLNDAPCFEERPRWRYGLGHRYARTSQT